VHAVLRLLEPSTAERHQPTELPIITDGLDNEPLGVMIRASLRQTDHG